MSPPGEPDPLYVLARRVLLDALEALGPHQKALILVGAQAVYVHTGPAGMAIAEHTTDADIALDPQLLAGDPKLVDAIQAADFRPAGDKVGSWLTTRQLGGKPVEVPLDLLVPEAVGGPGRRGARLGPHGNKAARKVKGLEAALIDKGEHDVASLEAADQRTFRVSVAGPAALLVAKAHKIAEREGDLGRSSDKDALDVLRLLRAADMAELAERFRRLSEDPVARSVTREAVAQLQQLFAQPESAGSQMAARAAARVEDPPVIAASCAALVADLLSLFR